MESASKEVRVTCVMTTMGRRDQCFLAPVSVNMKDVLLRKTTLYRSGFREIPADGSELECLVADGEKGPYVVKVLSKKQSTAQRLEGKAKLKFYNKDAGWGFLTLDDGVDVFFHVSTLKKCRINADALKTEQPFSVTAVSSAEGFKAVEMTLLG